MKFKTSNRDDALFQPPPQSVIGQQLLAIEAPPGLPGPMTPAKCQANRQGEYFI